MKLKDTKIYYINMDKHTDRRERIENLFEMHEFSDVTRVAGVVAENAIIGCAKAYLDVFEQAPDSNFIILEDDCVESSYFDPNMDMDFVEQMDGLYLGISCWARSEDPLSSKTFKSLKPETQKCVCMSMETLKRVEGYQAGDHYATSGPYLDVHDLEQNTYRKITNMLSTHAIYYKSPQMVNRVKEVIENTLSETTPMHIDCLYADIVQKELDVYCLDNPQFIQSSSRGATDFSLSEYDDFICDHLQGVYCFQDPLTGKWSSAI